MNARMRLSKELQMCVALGAIVTLVSSCHLTSPHITQDSVPEGGAVVFALGECIISGPLVVREGAGDTIWLQIGANTVHLGEGAKVSSSERARILSLHGSEVVASVVLRDSYWGGRNLHLMSDVAWQAVFEQQQAQEIVDMIRQLKDDPELGLTDPDLDACGWVRSLPDQLSILDESFGRMQSDRPRVLTMLLLYLLESMAESPATFELEFPWYFNGRINSRGRLGAIRLIEDLVGVVSRDTFSGTVDSEGSWGSVRRVDRAVRLFLLMTSSAGR